MIREEKNFYIYENEILKFLFTKRSVDAKDISVIKKVLSDRDFNAEELTYVTQVHGCDVVNLSSEKIESITQSDALVTNKRKLPMMIFTADCVPLIFYDEKAKNIGLAHAGWKGTFLQIAKNTVESMVNSYGSKVEDIKVFIGPHISFENYKVSEELIEKFAELKVDNYYKQVGDDYYLNLEEINKQVLIRNGILEKNITSSGLCTVRDNDKFFSYRKDKASPKRIGSIIELK